MRLGAYQRNKFKHTYGKMGFLTLITGFLYWELGQGPAWSPKLERSVKCDDRNVENALHVNNSTVCSFPFSQLKGGYRKLVLKLTNVLG